MKGLVVVFGGFSDGGEPFCAFIAGKMSLHAVGSIEYEWWSVDVVTAIERAMVARQHCIGDSLEGMMHAIVH
jgi:hypothetical protein